MIGAAIKFARGVKRTMDLPEAIAAETLKLDQPVISRFAGADRYFAAAGLIEATLFSADPAPAKGKQLVALDKLDREFRMARNDLANQNASKADVVALGIVVREIATGFDEEVRRFRSSAASKEIERMDDEISMVRRELQGLRDRNLLLTLGVVAATALAVIGFMV